jgi:hypothetical protein
MPALKSVIDSRDSQLGSALRFRSGRVRSLVRRVNAIKMRRQWQSHPAELTAITLTVRCYRYRSARWWSARPPRELVL